MKRPRRILLWLTAGFFVLAVLFLGLFALLPKFINTGSVKSTVQSGISEKLGAQVSYGRADLFFFPRPGVILHDGTVILRDRMYGSFDSLTAYLKILPLLRGSLEVSSLKFAAPNVSIRLERPEEKEIPTLEELRVKLKLLFRTIAEKLPDLDIIMKNGKLTLFEGDRAVFSFADMDADIVFPPRGPKIRITGSSDFSKAMTVLLQMDKESLAGKGEIELRQVWIQPLSRYLMPHGPVEVEGSGMDLKLRLRTADMKTIEGEVSSSLSPLTLNRKGKYLTIRGNRISGDFQLRDDRVEASLRELDLTYPRLKLAGTLVVDRGNRQISLNIEGRGIDVPSTREAAYSFAADVPIVQDVFGYVQGGTVPRITVSSRAGSFGELGANANIQIKGRIEHGKIFLKGPRLDFRDVSGDCVIINGMLYGTGISAGLDKARLQDGTLRVGLKGAVVPLRLETRTAVDLTELQGLLLRLLKDKAVLYEISLMKRIRGTARGRLIMAGDSASPTVVADVQEIDLSTDYARIPYSVRIIQGQVYYDDKKVATKGLGGTIGSSSFSGLTASLELKKGYPFDIYSGALNASLPEVHHWLASYETLKPALKGIVPAGGIVSLSSIGLKGPLLSPEEWRFRIGGSGRDIAFTSSYLPGSVTVGKTNFEATDGKLAVSGAEVRMLDSAVDLSGELSGYLKDRQKLDLALKGSVGPESFSWAGRKLTFPQWMRKSLGLSVESSRLVWESNRATSFSGVMTVSEGPRVSVDMVRDERGIKINRLFIEDSSSHATVSFTLDEHRLGLGFSGRLTEKTAASLIKTEDYRGGWISGDFMADVGLDRPVRFTANGKLEGDRLVIPWKESEPVEIDRLSIGADGTTFSLNSADLKWGEDKVSLRGDLKSSGQGILVDLDASAAVIDAGSLEKKMKKIGKEEKKQKKSGVSVPSAEGTIRLRAGQLTYDKARLAPFNVDISLNGQEVSAEVTKADFCGISLPGRVNIARDEIFLDFGPFAKDGDVESTISCFSHAFDLNEYATGTFDLSGKITGRGARKDIVSLIRGDIDFTAREGRIYQEPSILKVLAFLEFTEIVRGYGDVWRKGLAYDKVSVKCTLSRDRIKIEEGLLDSPYMKMASQGYVDLAEKKLDVKFLVSPLRTVDRIIEMIPVIGRLLGNTLLSVPVRVTGELKDPQVNAFSLSSADSGLLGILKPLTLPFKVFTPLFPGKKGGIKEERENAGSN